MVRGEAVGNGLEMKGGNLGGGEVGEIVEFLVVVVGAEKGDSETGVTEEVGETEEWLDVAFGRKRKEEDMIAGREPHEN